MSPTIDPKVERFERALMTAQIGPPALSQRQLGEKLGVSIGSISKYLRFEVHPDNVGFGIQCKLAKVLGHSIDALQSYYETGEWETDVTLTDIVSYIRSDAGIEALPDILEAMTIRTRRESGVDTLTQAKQVDYTWPIEELKISKVSDKMRKKLGLTDVRLKLLAKEGKFDDDMVEGFSIACNYEEDAVREAFEKRQPIAA